MGIATRHLPFGARPASNSRSAIPLQFEHHAKLSCMSGGKGVYSAQVALACFELHGSVLNCIGAGNQE